DPVTGVGAEAGAELRLEILGGPDQTEVSLADQVLEDEAAAEVIPRDLHYQAQVCLDHPAAGIFIALGDRVSQGAFFGRREQRPVLDLPEIDLKGIGMARVLRSCASHCKARPLELMPEANVREQRRSRFSARGSRLRRHGVRPREAAASDLRSCN